MNNDKKVIRTFAPNALEGKNLEGILTFFRELLIAAREEGFQDFELAVCEDGGYDVFGVDQMSNYAIPPVFMQKVLEGLGLTGLIIRK